MARARNGRLVPCRPYRCRFTYRARNGAVLTASLRVDAESELAAARVGDRLLRSDRRRRVGPTTHVEVFDLRSGRCALLGSWRAVEPILPPV